MSMPAGFYFDPYMGDDLGALRLGGSDMKIADDVDSAMAELLAWSIVTPALREIDRVYGQCDQHGRLWGHEWEVVAWMALASDAIRDLDRKESLSGARRWITGWVRSDDARDRMVRKGLE